LTDELARLERSLSDVRRERSTVRIGLPGLIAAGDTGAIAAARADIAVLDRRDAELAENLKETREAIGAAQARDRTLAGTKAYGNLKKLVGDARRDVEELASATEAFALALKAALVALNSVDTQMMRAGVSPDHYALRAKLMGIVQLALHVESGGLVGEARTLENHYELRQSGRCDLKLAAREYQTLTLQRLRNAFHIRELE
jgi:hypothetical protein